MTIEEVFSHLSAHMVKGLMIHDQLAAAYDFLNLCGYKKCHEYHYFMESCSYRCLQHYYIKHYHKLIPETSINNPQIIPSNWFKYAKSDVDTNTKRSAIRDLMKKWVDWEIEAKSLLEQSYKELYDQGEIGAALKIGCFLKDTSEELARAQEEQNNLESMGYDIVFIIEAQKRLKDKYAHKMKEIFEDDD